MSLGICCANTPQYALRAVIVNTINASAYIVHVAARIIRDYCSLTCAKSGIIADTVGCGIAVADSAPVDAYQFAEGINRLQLGSNHITIFYNSGAVVVLVCPHQTTYIHIGGIARLNISGIYGIDHMVIDQSNGNRTISRQCFFILCPNPSVRIRAVPNKSLGDFSVVHTSHAAHIAVAQHRAGRDRAAGDDSVLLVPSDDTADLGTTDIIIVSQRVASLVAGHGAVCQVAVLNGSGVETGKTAHPVTAIDISAVQSEILDLTGLSNSGKQAHAGIGLEARTGIQAADGVAVAIQHASKGHAVEVVIFTAGAKSKGVPGSG